MDQSRNPSHYDRTWDSRVDQDVWPPRHDTDSLSSRVSRVGARYGRGQRSYSAERTSRIAGIAGAGSLVALLGVAAFGSAPHHQRLAAAPDATFSSVDPAGVTGSLQTVPRAVPLVAPVSAAAGACTTTYTVRSGDYWIRIAKSAAVPLDQLLTLNHATAKTMLQPNQVLCLPDGTTIQAPMTTVKAPTTTVKTVTVAKVVHTAPKPAPVKKKVTASHHS